MDKTCYVYIMTSPSNTELYTGVTNDLRRRAFEHKEKMAAGFTGRYNVVRLVYYEVAESAESAIRREKAIKGSSRRKKMELLDRMNPQWLDLYGEL